MASPPSPPSPPSSPSSPPASDLRGASPEAVREALRSGDPFPGGRGFAGLLSDPPSRDGPVLVRDVLGREPLFVERGAADRETRRDPTARDAWGFDRTDLDDPEPLPAGCIASADGVERVWALPEDGPVDPQSGQAAVDAAIDGALADLGAPVDDGASARSETDALAVAFSGGVDSGLVAAAVPDAPRYVAGFEGCHDVAAAREAAEAMAAVRGGHSDGNRDSDRNRDHDRERDCDTDGDLRVVEITHDDLVRAVREVARATGRRNPMDVAIAVPLYLTAEAVAADGIDRLAIGQGADELFGGYSKVVDPADDHRVDADTVRGARTETVRTLPDQLERDVLALRAAGVEPVAPLLDDRVVAAALALPGGLLATGDERKVALRRAAAGRVPDSVRTADKKAVQYGTYVSRELDRLARRAGFKRRMDDHVGQYVDSLLTDD